MSGFGNFGGGSSSSGGGFGTQNQPSSNTNTTSGGGDKNATTTGSSNTGAQGFGSNTASSTAQGFGSNTTTSNTGGFGTASSNTTSNTGGFGSTTAAAAAATTTTANTTSSGTTNPTSTGFGTSNTTTAGATTSGGFGTTNTASTTSTSGGGFGSAPPSTAGSTAAPSVTGVGATTTTAEPVTRTIPQFPLSRSQLDQCLCEGALTDSLIRQIQTHLTSSPLSLTISDFIKVDQLQAEINKEYQQQQQNQQQQTDSAAGSGGSGGAGGWGSSSTNKPTTTTTTTTSSNLQGEAFEAWQKKSKELEADLCKRNDEVLRYIALLLSAPASCVRGVAEVVQHISKKLHSNLIEFASYSGSAITKSSSSSSSGTAAATSSSSSSGAGFGFTSGSSSTTASTTESFTLTSNITRERCRQQSLELLFQLCLVLIPAEESTKLTFGLVDKLISAANHSSGGGSGGGASSNWGLYSGGHHHFGDSASGDAAISSSLFSGQSQYSSSSSSTSDKTNQIPFSPSIATLASISVFALAASMSANLDRSMQRILSSSATNKKTSSEFDLPSSLINFAMEWCTKYRNIRISQQQHDYSSSSSSSFDPKNPSNKNTENVVDSQHSHSHLSSLALSLLGVAQYSIATAAVLNDGGKTIKRDTSMNLALEAVASSSFYGTNGDLSLVSKTVSGLNAWQSLQDRCPSGSCLLSIPRFMFLWVASFLVKQTLSNNCFLPLVKRISDMDVSSSRAFYMAVNDAVAPPTTANASGSTGNFNMLNPIIGNSTTASAANSVPASPRVGATTNIAQQQQQQQQQNLNLSFGSNRNTPSFTPTTPLLFGIQPPVSLSGQQSDVRGGSLARQGSLSSAHQAGGLASLGGGNLIAAKVAAVHPPLNGIPTLLRLLSICFEELPVERSLLCDLGGGSGSSDSSSASSDNTNNNESMSYLALFLFRNLGIHLRNFVRLVPNPIIAPAQISTSNNQNINNNNEMNFLAQNANTNNQSQQQPNQNSSAQNTNNDNTRGIFNWSAATYKLFSNVVAVFTVIAGRLQKQHSMFFNKQQQQQDSTSSTNSKTNLTLGAGAETVVQALKNMQQLVDCPSLALQELQRRAFEVVGLVAQQTTMFGNFLPPSSGAQNTGKDQNSSSNNNISSSGGGIHGFVATNLYGSGTERVANHLPNFAQPNYFEKQVTRFASKVFDLCRVLLHRAPLQSQLVYDISATCNVDWLIAALSGGDRAMLAPSSAGAIFGALSAVILHSDISTGSRVLSHFLNVGLFGHQYIPKKQQQQNNQQNQQQQQNRNSVVGGGDSIRSLFMQELKTGQFPLVTGFIDFALAASTQCPHHEAIPIICRFISEDVLPTLMQRIVSSSSSSSNNNTSSHHGGASSSNQNTSSSTSSANSQIKNKDELRILGALCFIFLGKAIDIGVALDDALTWSRAPQDVLGEAISCIILSANYSSCGIPIWPAQAMLTRGALNFLLAVAHRCNIDDVTGNNSSNIIVSQQSQSQNNNNNPQNTQQSSSSVYNFRGPYSGTRSFSVDARTSQSPDFIADLLKLLQTSDILIATATINLLTEYSSAFACNGAQELQKTNPVEAAGVRSALMRFATIAAVSTTTQTSSDSKQQKECESHNQNANVSATTSSTTTTTKKHITVSDVVTVFHPPLAGIVYDRIYSIDQNFYEDVSTLIETLRMRTLEMLCSHAPLPFPSTVSLAFGLPLGSANTSQQNQLYLSNTHLGGGSGGFGGASRNYLEAAAAAINAQLLQQQHSQFFSSIMDCLGDATRCYHNPESTALMAKFIHIVRRYHPSVALLQGELKRRDGTDILDTLHTLSSGTVTPLSTSSASEKQNNNRSSTQILDAVAYLRYAFLIATLSRDVLTLRCPSNVMMMSSTSTTQNQNISAKSHLPHAHHNTPHLTYGQEAVLRHLRHMISKPKANACSRLSDVHIERWYGKIIDGIPMASDAAIRVPESAVPLDFIQWIYSALATIRGLPSLPNDLVCRLRDFTASAASSKNKNVQQDNNSNNNQQNQQQQQQKSSHFYNDITGVGGVLAPEAAFDRIMQPTIDTHHSNKSNQQQNMNKTSSAASTLLFGKDSALPFQSDLFLPREKLEHSIPHYELQAVLEMLRLRHQALQLVSGGSSSQQNQQQNQNNFPSPQSSSSQQYQQNQQQQNQVLIVAAPPVQEWKQILELFAVHNYISKEHACIVTFIQSWSDMVEVLCWRSALDGLSLRVLFESFRAILHLFIKIGNSNLTPSAQARTQTDLGRALLAFATTIQRVAEATAFNLRQRVVNATTTQQSSSASQQQQQQNQQHIIMSNNATLIAELRPLASRIIASTAYVLDLVADTPSIRSNTEASLLLMLHTFFVLGVPVEEPILCRLEGTFVPPAIHEYCKGVAAAVVSVPSFVSASTSTSTSTANSSLSNILPSNDTPALSSAVVSANLLRWLFQRPQIAVATSSSPMFHDGFMNEVRLPRARLLHLVETTCGTPMNRLISSLFAADDDIIMRVLGLSSSSSSGSDSTTNESSSTTMNTNNNNSAALMINAGSLTSFGTGTNAQCLPLYVAEAGFGMLSAIASSGCSIELFNTGGLKSLWELSMWAHIQDSIVGFTALQTLNSQQQQQSSSSTNASNSVLKRLGIISSSSSVNESTNVAQTTLKSLFGFEVSQKILLSVLRLLCAMLVDVGPRHASIPLEIAGLLRSRTVLFSCIFSHAFVRFCENLIRGRDFEERAVLAISVLTETTRYLSILCNCDAMKGHCAFIVSEFKLVNLLKEVVSSILRIVPTVTVLHKHSHHHHNKKDASSSPAKIRFVLSLFETLSYICSIIERGVALSYSVSGTSSSSSQNTNNANNEIIAGFNLPTDLNEICLMLRALRTLYPEKKKMMFSQQQQQQNKNTAEASSPSRKNQPVAPSNDAESQQQQQNPYTDVVASDANKNKETSSSQHLDAHFANSFFGRFPDALSYCDNSILHLLVSISLIHDSMDKVAKKESEADGGFVSNASVAQKLLFAAREVILPCVEEVSLAFPHAYYLWMLHYSSSSGFENENEDGSSEDVTFAAAASAASATSGGDNNNKTLRKMEAEFHARQRIQNSPAASIPGILQRLSNVVTPAGSRRTRALYTAMN